jgi:serine/threonine protein kinase
LQRIAAGEWRKAAEALDEVARVAPDFRDVRARAAQLRLWLRSVGVREQGEGRVGGRYELLGELGRGGMAIVYRAHDSVLGRDVAMKFMSEHISQRGDLREMFQREARSVAALNHPNIVTIHDFGVAEGRLFICMELLDGATVDQRIQADGRIPVLESLRMVRQALAALEYAHRRSIVHRDIKPSNLLVTREGIVKLVDFGVAKNVEASDRRSRSGGTPPYMAPEQILGAPADARIDVFALGVTLYEMLTGELPFPGYARPGPPEPPSARASSVPAAVDALVLGAIELETARRFADARSFAGEIDAVLAEVARASGSRAA